MISYRFAVILVALSLGLAACGPKPAPPTPKPPKSPSPAAVPGVDLHALYEKNAIQVTLEEFDQVRPGMTEDEVVAIIGVGPTGRTSRYNPADEDGFTRPSATIILRWDNPDDSWCELEMRNKKVELKRHQDLRPAASYRGGKFNLPLPPADPLSK